MFDFVKQNIRYSNSHSNKCINNGETSLEVNESQSVHVTSAYLELFNLAKCCLHDIYGVTKQLFCLFVCLLSNDFCSCCLAGIPHNGGSHNDYERKIH